MRQFIILYYFRSSLNRKKSLPGTLLPLTIVSTSSAHTETVVTKLKQRYILGVRKKPSDMEYRTEVQCTAIKKKSLVIK